MLVSYHSYAIATLVPILLIAVILLLSRKKIGVIFLIVFSIPILVILGRTFPLVYQINSCGSFQVFVLISEKEWNDGQSLRLNNPFTLWKNLNNYVVNVSSRNIEIEYLTYLDHREMFKRRYKNEIDMKPSVLLEPMSMLRIPFQRIDYLFEPAPVMIEMGGSSIKEKIRLFCSE